MTKVKVQESAKVGSLPQFEIILKNKVKASERKVIKNASDCAEVCRMCFDADTIEWTESFIVIALNNANKVLGFYKVSSGGTTGTVVDPKVVFQFALLSCATNIIIAHNHPSGGLEPSSNDKNMTKRLREGAALLDIKLLDHIIITAEHYFSFAEDGLI